MNYSPTGEDLFSEKVIDLLEREGLTINWRYGYRLANRYEVKRVHSGGFGIVWIVEDEMQQAKRYAAKAPRAYFRKFTDPKEDERRQVLANMFLNECKIWVDLGKHRHIVQAEFLEKIEGVPIVMAEYIEGGDLERVLEERRLNIASILDYAIQFCLGMEYAKEQGVAVHRDIKPGNIMVTENNVVKINDFGLAKAIEAIEPIVVKERMEISSEVRLGSFSRGRGTPGYMAPEQFPEKILELCGYPALPITTRSDIFSFGLVLYEMASGKPAFAITIPNYEEMFSRVNHACAQLPPKLQHWSPRYISYLLKWHTLTPKLIACNEYLDGIIARCLMIDPEERYESFSELKGELSKLYQQITEKEYEVIEEPTYKPSWRNLGKTYWILGREEEAFVAYDKALEENPGDTLARLEKGLTSAEAGDLEEFGLCTEVIPYLKPSQEQAVEQHKEIILKADQIQSRDNRLLDRLAFEYMVSHRVQDWVSSEVERRHIDPFREPNPAISKLLGELKDENSERRYSAAEALGELGDRTAVPALIEALEDEDKYVRYHAAEALGKLGDRTAIPALMFLGKSRLEGRGSAAVALARLGHNSVVSLMIDYLKDEDEDQRLQASRLLGNMGDRAAVPALIEALEDEVREVRFNAVEALGKLGDRAAVPALIESLLIAVLETKDDDWLYSVAKVLYKLGDRTVIAALIEALKAKDADWRESAAQALGELGDRTAVPALIETLKDEDSGVRKEAAQALDHLGDRTAVPALIEALKDEDEYVRSFAASALGQAGDPEGVPALIEAFADNSDAAWIAPLALGLIGDRAAVPVLIEVLMSKNKFRSLDYSAAEALGELGDEAAVPALIEALKDEDAALRMKAAQALGKIGDRTAVPALIEALKDDGARFVGPTVQESAAEALVKLTGKQTLTKLLEALDLFPESHKAYVVRTLRMVCSNSDKEKLAKIKGKLKEYSALEWYKMGSEFTAQERYQEALASFERAIDINPDWEEPKMAKNECLGKLSQ